MAVNSLFKTSGTTNTTEKNLYSDLVKESIQIYGHDVNYIDRTLQAKDNIFGEDSLSQFNKAQTIEMYVEDSSGGYQGEKEVMQQFGLENRNEITFVVHRTRFDDVMHQVDIESGTDTTEGSILLESGTDSGEGGDDQGFLNTESGESIVLEDASQDNPTGFGNFILFETGSQDADGVLKIRVNGEDKYIQLYNLVS